jgi:hypothetical protein
MKSFHAAVSIEAPADRVWGVLTDVAHWADWNTTVDRVDGRVALGAKVTVFAKISPGRAFPVKVVRLDPPVRMVWRGGMPFGLFVGERTFTIAPESEIRCRLVTREEFSGLLAPLIMKSMPDLQPTLDTFVRNLKATAERW